MIGAEVTAKGNGVKIGGVCMTVELAQATTISGPIGVKVGKPITGLKSSGWKYYYWLEIILFLNGLIRSEILPQVGNPT